MSTAPQNGRRERAGWRPDPAGRFEQRYYIAGTWTRRVRHGDAEAIDTQDVDDDGHDDDGRHDIWQARGSEDRGWRRDPTGRFEQRWHDGERYTRKVRIGTAVATDTQGADVTRGEPSPDGDAPPPGWRPDPEGEGQRYWDGYQWTAKQRAGPSESAEYSMRGWWSQTVLTALAALAALLALVGLVVAVVLLL